MRTDGGIRPYLSRGLSHEFHGRDACPQASGFGGATCGRMGASVPTFCGGSLTDSMVGTPALRRPGLALRPTDGWGIRPYLSRAILIGAAAR
jgi:hypothetical protein